MTKSEQERYSKQTILKEFGVLGQEKLKVAKILVVGAGGLGSGMLPYLASAGIGTIGIVDHDQISLSNLQRQVLYKTNEVGNSKVEKARTFLKGLNPEVLIKTYDEKLSQNY